MRHARARCWVAASRDLFRKVGGRGCKRSCSAAIPVIVVCATTLVGCAEYPCDDYDKPAAASLNTARRSAARLPHPDPGEWSRVDKTSVADLEAFLRRHGRDPEADDARARLSELRKQQADAAQAENATKNKTVGEVRTKAEPQRLAMLQRPEGDKSRAATHAVELHETATDESRPGHEFRDCSHCPTMVVVPAGEFMMGSTHPELALAKATPDGSGSSPLEEPRHKVVIANPFAIGKFLVTFAEWDACVAAGACSHRPEDRGWGRDTRPVINVSWNDAREYVAWLNRETGKTYRMLSEA
jgi:hypothetical protein